MKPRTTPLLVALMSGFLSILSTGIPTGGRRSDRVSHKMFPMKNTRCDVASHQYFLTTCLMLHLTVNAFFISKEALMLAEVLFRQPDLLCQLMTDTSKFRFQTTEICLLLNALQTGKNPRTATNDDHRSSVTTTCTQQNEQETK